MFKTKVKRRKCTAQYPYIYISIYFPTLPHATSSARPTTNHNEVDEMTWDGNLAAEEKQTGQQGNRDTIIGFKFNREKVI